MRFSKSLQKQKKQQRKDTCDNPPDIWKQNSETWWEVFRPYVEAGAGDPEHVAQKAEGFIQVAGVISALSHQEAISTTAVSQLTDELTNYLAYPGQV